MMKLREALTERRTISRHCVGWTLRYLSPPYLPPSSYNGIVYPCSRRHLLQSPFLGARSFATRCAPDSARNSSFSDERKRGRLIGLRSLCASCLGTSPPILGAERLLNSPLNSESCLNFFSKTTGRRIQRKSDATLQDIGSLSEPWGSSSRARETLGSTEEDERNPGREGTIACTARGT
jgi:hypothetical protein